MEALLAGLRAAAEPTRLRLLALCAESELTVSELTHILDQSQPRVSRHLKLLCEASLMQRFREGSWAFFRIANEGPCAALARRIVAEIPRDDPVFARDRARRAEIAVARARAASAYFRANAESWDRIRALHADTGRIEAAIRALVPECPGRAGRDSAGGAGRALLDLGTGTGRMLALLADRVTYAVGVDTSREMLGVARVNLARAGVTNCSVRQADMYALPWDGPTFHIITMHMVLHYAQRPSEAIAEAARVLCPGGRLIIADFAPHDLEELRHDHAHRRLGFADAEVAQWCAGADLTPAAARRLDGGRLAVTLWSATMPRASDGATPDQHDSVGGANGVENAYAGGGAP